MQWIYVFSINYEASLIVKANGKNQIKGCQKNFWFDKKELISLEKKKGHGDTHTHGKKNAHLERYVFL